VDFSLFLMQVLDCVYLKASVCDVSFALAQMFMLRPKFALLPRRTRVFAFQSIGEKLASVLKVFKV
jgi:hypothetical protein